MTAEEMEFKTRECANMKRYRKLSILPLMRNEVAGLNKKKIYFRLSNEGKFILCSIVQSLQSTC